MKYSFKTKCKRKVFNLQKDSNNAYIHGTSKIFIIEEKTNNTTINTLLSKLY